MSDFPVVIVDERTLTMTDLGNVLTATDEQECPSHGHYRNINGCPDCNAEKNERFIIRFSTTTHRIYPGNAKRINRRTKPLAGAVLLHYVERPVVTPTGGRWTARRMTVKTADGRKWVGTMRKDTDIVTMRPDKR